MEKFNTEIHSQENNTIVDKQDTETNSAIDEYLDIGYFLRVNYRLFRKTLSSYFRKKTKQTFTKILYITLDKIPFDYIVAFQKQYPDKTFQVLIPITKIDGLKKTSISFEFFLQNKMHNATLYRFPRNSFNVEILGLYSNVWQNDNIQKFQYLAPFIKSARICAKKLKPDIIHSENIPFFLGAEFESKLPYGIPVFQTIKDFYLLELNKTEAFWSAINLVDKLGMKKICRDKIIRKCIATLFNLHNTKRFYQLKECLEFIYQNYSQFRKYIDKCEDIDENIIFNRMNARVLKLFPQMAYENELLYNAMFNTIKQVDCWAVASKTYYEEIFNNPELSGKMYNRLASTKTKSNYISYGCETEDAKIYQSFNRDNFRELREKNKQYILREFSYERIKTKFMDSSLFKTDNYIIRGFLDSFYDSPLIFCTYTPEIFSQGIDIGFSTILKLFELNKNIQVIINIPNELNQTYIQNAISFLEQNNLFNGRWLYIDGEINISQFFAAADMALFSKRININNSEHFLALKYGCIPIALKNGIYNDTIADIFDDMANGCGFKTKTSIYTNHCAWEIYFNTVIKAINLYTQNHAGWNLLIKNALEYNSAWTFEIIEKYNQIYEKL